MLKLTGMGIHRDNTYPLLTHVLSLTKLKVQSKSISIPHPLAYRLVLVWLSLWPWTPTMFIAVLKIPWKSVMYKFLNERIRWLSRIQVTIASPVPWQVQCSLWNAFVGCHPHVTAVPKSLLARVVRHSFHGAQVDEINIHQHYQALVHSSRARRCFITQIHCK